MSIDRRSFLSVIPAAAAGASITSGVRSERTPDDIVRPPERPAHGLLLSCKSSMLQGSSPAAKLRLAREAGYDGVDFDEAGSVTPEALRDAVRETGVFVHGAINHAHWNDRLTSPDPEMRARGLTNLLHCIRVSHAAGGSGVLLVIGAAADGSEAETLPRAREEIRRAIPLAAALGQQILVENVWNGLLYEDRGPRDQSASRFADFIDSFQSPWVGMFFDLGNHARYGDVAQWTRELGARTVKLDIKGYSNARADRENDAGRGFVDITDGDIDWASVRAALREIGFTGWVSAEVGGGGLERHRTILAQMRSALISSTD